MIPAATIETEFHSTGALSRRQRAASARADDVASACSHMLGDVDLPAGVNHRTTTRATSAGKRARSARRG